ncbi:MAG TPA: lysylphosphatidylglycerol synthase transmembrane domain-containing protein [Candidatus Bilamarchaeum sp.]|nr:lysylphosphatidylglycerol synthase transmembrane domain-containing protein [Candidatus Bilamarchaeum sp.]
MDRRAVIAFNLIVSLAIIAALLHLVGAEKVALELQKADPLLILFSIAALFAMDVLMSYRIKILLDAMKQKIRYIDILRSHFVGMLLADFTPSRTGYFATAGVLRYNYGVESDKALLSIFGPQIFDFAFKVAVGSAAILYLLSAFISPHDGWMLFLGAGLISVAVLVMLLVLFSKRFLSMFAFVRGFPVVAGLYDVVLKMQDSSHIVVSKTPHIIAIILLNWFFRALSWYFAGKAVGITIDFGFHELVFYMFLQPLLTMLEFAPSPTIAGMGLSESGATLVFSLFGVDPAKAATFGLLVRFKSTFLHLPAVPEALRMPDALAAEMEAKGKKEGDVILPE